MVNEKKEYQPLEMIVYKVTLQDIVTASPGGTLFDPEDDYGFDTFAPLGFN